MGRRRGLLLEIQGCPIAFTLNEVILAPVQFGQTIVEAITSIPQSQNMSVNPIEGTFESSGITLNMNKESGILLARLGTPETYLEAELAYNNVTALVKDVSGFPVNGHFWIGEECVQYVGTTVNPGDDTFDNLVRGAYGTSAQTHRLELGTTAKVRSKVKGYNPKIHGRKCWVYWYDLDSPATKSLRFIGYIERFDSSDTGYTLTLLNGSQKLDDAECMAGRYAEGKLLGAYVNASNVEYGNILANAPFTQIGISVDNDDYPFPLHLNDNDARDSHFQIGEEIFEYFRSAHPGRSGVVDAVGTTGATCYFETDRRFYKGDYISFANAAGETRYGYVTVEFAGVAAQWRYYHTVDENPVVTETVITPGIQLLTNKRRGVAKTFHEDHEIGSTVKEVRIMGEDTHGDASGNHVDCLLQLLTSTGNGRNGDFDTLPENCGAGIDYNLIDIDAFLLLVDYAATRRFVFTEPVKVKKLLQDLARVTGARIFWGETGQLTCSTERDIYPDSSTIASFVDADLCSRPRWSTGMDRIFNCWIWRGNAPRGSDYLDHAYFDDAESVALHGKRSLPDLEDPGLVHSRIGDVMEILAVSCIMRWSDLCPYLEIDILLPAEGTVFRPGRLVSVSISHLPNLAGYSGISDTFEVLSYTPRDPDGEATLVLAAMPSARNTGLIAPSAEVASVADPVVTLKASSATHYADATNGWANDINCLPTGEDGKEDVDYFKIGHAITFWDMSTLGDGPMVSADTTISDIDYATKEVTVAAMPAWLAAGDAMRLSDYATVKASAKPEPVDWYICLADETSTPPDLSSDDANTWGL